MLDPLITFFVTTMGILISFGYYPQAYKLWRNKSSENISISTYVILGLGTTTYLAYGFYKNDVAIIAGFLFGVIGSWLVLFLTLYYRTGKGNRAINS